MTAIEEREPQTKQVLFWHLRTGVLCDSASCLVGKTFAPYFAISQDEGRRHRLVHGLGPVRYARPREASLRLAKQVRIHPMEPNALSPTPTPRTSPFPPLRPLPQQHRWVTKKQKRKCPRVGGPLASTHDTHESTERPPLSECVCRTRVPATLFLWCLLL